MHGQMLLDVLVFLNYGNLFLLLINYGNLEKFKFRTQPERILDVSAIKNCQNLN